LFGLGGFFIFLYLLVLKAIKRDVLMSSIYIVALVSVGIYFLVVSVQMGWFTALTQIMLAGVSLVLMVVSNFAEKWVEGDPRVNKTAILVYEKSRDDIGVENRRRG